jgi:hypothetical protein
MSSSIVVADQTAVPFYVMVALVALIIGLAKGGLGGSLGAMATPLMALVLPANRVLGLVLPMLMIADIFAVSWLWGYWRRQLVLLLLPGGILGVTLGAYVIVNAPTALLQALLGGVILLFAAYKLFEDRLLGDFHYQPHAWHGLLAGTTAGFASSLAHTGGPPISIYLVLQHVSPVTFNATTALFFAILNWVKAPYYLYAGLFDWGLLWRAVWALPLLPVGVWLGARMARQINPQVFERIIILLLTLTGVLLLLQALS